MRKRNIVRSLALLLSCLLLSGCGTGAATPAASSGTIRDHTPVVLTPEASGEDRREGGAALLDVSHTDRGYLMACYTGAASRVYLQLVTPDEVTYQYCLNTDGSFSGFPLSGGDGEYTVRVLENVQEDLYACILTDRVEVQLENEFLPWLYANQYSSFTAESRAVSLAEELSEGLGSDLEVVAAVYNYVVKNIRYDYAKAEEVSAGYLPDVDAVLAEGKGICFDYASLMVAMLRSQRIPTRLEVGYAGTAYHAWIDVYVEGIGWVNKVVQFNGNEWKLMDPTFAANSNGKKDVVGDGSSYLLKYSY